MVAPVVRLGRGLGPCEPPSRQGAQACLARLPSTGDWQRSTPFPTASLLGACSQGLVDDVPPEVCASGERWIGGLTGNEWM
ncbi:MAG: hypothetical protein ABI895_01210 [Deltaproteobacteria bacterium]